MKFDFDKLVKFTTLVSAIISGISEILKQYNKLEEREDKKKKIKPNKTNDYKK